MKGQTITQGDHVAAKALWSWSQNSKGWSRKRNSVPRSGSTRLAVWNSAKPARPSWFIRTMSGIKRSKLRMPKPS
ncbi:UNVERIFIED_CONTAM: hypothetical protein GTU68_029172 [Idotea baltica]|nr:hypothetical protein [Idotea baltica]